MLAGEYTAYTLEVDKATVATLFEQRHGYRPAEVLDTGAVWLAGPLNANGRGRSLLARVEATLETITPERARQLVMELGG